MPIEVPRGRAVRIGTPLLSLAVRSGRGGSVLLVGTVGPEVLERAVVELSGGRGRDRRDRHAAGSSSGSAASPPSTAVDLRVPAGIRFGLLGPNGSGKTTLVRMLLGLVHATAGEVELLGEPMPRRAAHVLPRVGALVEGPAAWAAPVRPHEPAPDRRRRPGPRRAGGSGSTRRWSASGLGGIDRRPVRAYSLGMRQRLGIAAALLRGPELLLLDEPTNGLDPRGHRRDPRRC